MDVWNRVTGGIFAALKVVTKYTGVLFVSVAFTASTTGQVGGPRSKPALWEPPPIFPHMEIAAKASVPKNLIQTLKVSGNKIALEDTSMESMRKRLGGTIGHGGDASEYLAWLCYEIRGNTGRSVFWLLSGELDNGAVAGFQWSNISLSTKVDRRCKVLPEKAVELPIPLRLGMSCSEVLQLLGKPSRIRAGLYDYEHTENLTIRNEPYTESNSVYVSVRKGKVKSILVWKSTVS